MSKKSELIFGLILSLLFIFLIIITPIITHTVKGATYSPIVGAVTDNSAKICIKTFRPCYIEYSNNEYFNEFKVSIPKDNFVYLNDLQPNTTYYYRIIKDTIIVDYGKFKTFPTESDKSKFTFLVCLSFFFPMFIF